ncbi:MAG: hypothetical protein HC869_04850 [Rhodospirillales bacterium]|nr:hypothetical protein [Rhodospirillales bacterium]
MARGRPVVVGQVVFVLAYFAAGLHAAIGQTGQNPQGLRLGLPGIKLPGVVVTTPTSISLNRDGLAATLPGANVAGLITTTPTSASLSGKGATVVLSGASVSNLATVSSASVNVSRNGAQVVLPGASVTGLATVTPTSISLDGKGATVTLPGTNVANLVVVTPTAVSLNKEGATIALPNIDVAGANVVTGPVLEIPGTIPSGGQPPVTLPASEVLNQASSAANLFAGMGSAQVFAPVEQMLASLAFGNDGPGACANSDPSPLAPVQSADIWAWNSTVVGRTDHDGYQLNDRDGNACGASLPFQTLERAQLPGVLWDASSAFGLKKGTLHMGLSGGAAATDTQVKANAALRDSGIGRAGTTRLQSWSVGGFSLLTTDKWYAGSAFGGSWGHTESQNFVLGSDSDYDTSTFVAAGFVGSIVPLTDTLRLDVRGTLSYQRTVGDAHVDSLGVVYGDHVISAADAVLSGRLFGVFRQDGLTIRPFIQGGIAHHLSYGNNLEIDGIAYTLQEADTTIFAATGLDFEIDRTLQLSVGVRRDHSSDSDGVTGRFGFSLRLN